MDMDEVRGLMTPEGQRELTLIYGPTLSHQEWTEWNDVPTKEDKALVSQIEEELAGCESCPYLGKRGDYFRYCKAQAQTLYTPGRPLNDKVPRITSPEFESQIDSLGELKQYCLNEEEYPDCLAYQDAQER